MEKMVIALGGNALQDEKKGIDSKTQLDVIKKTAVYLVDIIEEGYNLVITHGNGPQVGRIIIQNEFAKDITPAMPFDICGAMSQGMLGYHIQQAIGDELRKRKIYKPIASVVTQVVVDSEDKGFTNPTKPIGPFYSKEDAKELGEKGYTMVEDSGRGYRRVVPSPDPRRIVELETIKTLVENDNIVIAVGGGGIPVVEDNGELKGIAAVIDKDLASEKLAEDIDADILMILTQVEKVALNFGKSNQIELDRVNTKDMRKHIEEGHFAAGSMLPKVLAGIRFVESRMGRKTIITSLNMAKEALKGINGTIIE